MNFDDTSPGRSSAVIFALLLLALFDAELAVMEHLSPLFLRIGIVSASFLDAFILSLTFALFLWLLTVRPLFGISPSGSAEQSVGLAASFLQAMTIIFLVEFLIMMVLPRVMGDSDRHVLNLADAGLTVLLCALPLWRLLFRTDVGNRSIVLNRLLVDPIRLYILLLVMVFLIDYLEERVFFLFPALQHNSFFAVLDPVVTTLITAPFLWWFVVRPLGRYAEAEKTRADAVQAQVVDAVVGIDAHGLIESFNPAAEKIFGYAARDVMGTPAAVLFSGDHRFVGELVQDGSDSPGDGPRRIVKEIVGTRRGGSVLTLNISVSRVMLDGRQQFLLIMRDISERVKMEQALRASEERFVLAVNGANDGIWDWNVRTDEVYYSPRLRDLLGYRESEMESSFATFESLLHPEDHDRILEEIHAHLERRIPYDVELRLRTRGGSFRWFRARGQAIWDDSGNAERMAGSVSDITAHKEAEEALRDSETRFRQIFEQSEDAIVFLKPGSCSIIDANATAEMLYGYSRDELKEKGVEGLCKPEDLSHFSRTVCRIVPCEETHLDSIVNLRKDGTEIVVSVRSKIIVLQDVPVVYCTFRDITERVRMEEAARDIQARLIQANKMTSLGLLVSGVAHEINNPNNFILANSQLLHRVWQDAQKVLGEYYRENGDFQLGGLPFSVLKEDAPQLFGGITEGARRINEIVDNLKGVARDDSKGTGKKVDINHVVAKAVTILLHQLNKHTENFQTDLAQTLPAVNGNSQQLEQVVINLLMNACQALPSKQCGIRVATCYDEDSGQVALIVRDEGLGMLEQVSSRIMEPFFTTKLDSGGTGLGLFISNAIIREHRGSLEFTSEPGRGTTFTVKIPAVSTVAQEIS